MKPINTGLYLLWSSFTVKGYKIGLFFCLIHRSFKICSNWKQFNTEITILMDVFKGLGYPVTTLDSIVAKYISKLFVKGDLLIDSKKKYFYVKLPYIGSYATQIQRKLKRLVDKFASHIDLQIVFHNSFTICTLFSKSLKQKIDKLQRSKVIYMIRCRDCSANYIGKTNRKLVTRICEHRAVLKGKGFLCVAAHVFATGHVVDWDNASTIGMAKTDLQLV